MTQFLFIDGGRKEQHFVDLLFSSSSHFPRMIGNFRKLSHFPIMYSTGLPNKACPRLRDLATVLACGITRPRTSLIREPCKHLEEWLKGIASDVHNTWPKIQEPQFTFRCRCGGGGGVTYQMHRRAGELPEEEITISACRVPDYVSPETRGQWPYSRSAARVLKMEQTWVRHDLYLLQCPEYILV